MKVETLKVPNLRKNKTGTNLTTVLKRVRHKVLGEHNKIIKTNNQKSVFKICSKIKHLYNMDMR